MAYTRKEQDFIQYVKSRCKEHGVKCSLRNSTYVKINNSAKCSGWFDETIPELAVAMGAPQSMGVLAHEYSHLTQWVERIPLWIQAEKSLPIVWDWIDGKDNDDIYYHLSVARDLELDNEKRAVNIIQRFGLDIDVDLYIQKANAYVQFYNYLAISRRWSKPPRTPYSNERLIAAMPTTFTMNYKKLSKKVEKIFVEENI